MTKKKGGIATIDLIAVGVAAAAVIGIVIFLSAGDSSSSTPTRVAAPSSEATSSSGSRTSSPSKSKTRPSKGRLVVDYTNSNSNRDQPAAEPASEQEPATEEDLPEDLGVLSEAAIQNTIDRYRRELSYCYDFDRAEAYDPGRVGQIILQFRVEPDGRVQRGALFQDEFGADAACIGNVLRIMRFPAPAGGAVDVRFPVTLRRSDRR